MTSVKSDSPCWVYVIECGNGKLYPGVSKDPEGRFREHQSGHGALLTRIHKPKRMLWKEKCPDRSTAMRMESQLKRFSHWEKLVWLFERGAVSDPGPKPVHDKSPSRRKRTRKKTIFAKVIREMASERIDGEESSVVETSAKIG